MQAGLKLTGRIFQSRGAAAMKDRSPMVTFVKRFGVLRRIPLLFPRKPYRDGGKAEIESFRSWALEYFKGGKKDFKLDT